MKNEILDQLDGGDLRSEGNAEIIAKQIINNSELISKLFIGIHSDNKLIRGRVTMTLEIISRTDPKLIEPFIEKLIIAAKKEKIPQARWHIAEIIPNINISQDNQKKLIPIFLEYLTDKSKIVKYCVIQALGFIGKSDKEIIMNEITKYIDTSKSMNKIIEKTKEMLG